MSKYINRDKLIMEGWSLQRTYQKDAATMVCEMKKPEDFHAADVRPVRRGEWSVAIGYDPKRSCLCSLCQRMNYEPSNYCPNCGADMRGSTDG